MVSTDEQEEWSRQSEQQHGSFVGRHVSWLAGQSSQSIIIARSHSLMWWHDHTANGFNVSSQTIQQDSTDRLSTRHSMSIKCIQKHLTVTSVYCNLNFNFTFRLQTKTAMCNYSCAHYTQMLRQIQKQSITTEQEITLARQCCAGVETTTDDGRR